MKKNEEFIDIGDISSHFNNVFSEVGQKLAAKIPNNNYTEKIIENPNSMFLAPTCSHEVYKSILNLKEKKSVGIDHISTTTLKEIAYEISEPISHLINRSFACSTFIKREEKIML